MAKETINTNIFAKRFRPDFRYVDDKFIVVPLNIFKSTEPSKTDKEAYRVSLASLRGELASGSGSLTVGSYSIPAGQDYDVNKDFSFLNRPDLTIVQLDEYIEDFKTRLESYDEHLNADIEKQLVKAQQKREELIKAENTKNENKGE